MRGLVNAATKNLCSASIEETEAGNLCEFQVNLVYKEFQDSWGYIERPCLKIKKDLKNPDPTHWDTKDVRKHPGGGGGGGRGTQNLEWGQNSLVVPGQCTP